MQSLLLIAVALMARPFGVPGGHAFYVNGVEGEDLASDADNDRDGDTIQLLMWDPDFTIEGDLRARARITPAFPV